MTAITVLLADNQPLTCAGLMHMINDRDDITIVGKVPLRDRLNDLLSLHQPQLLIVDYSLPGYVTADDLSQVKQKSPRTNVLVISSDIDQRRILQVLQHGVLGYIRKDASREEIMMGIYATAKGEKFFSHEILNIILDKRFSNDAEAIATNALTARETEILTLLASGYSTQKIADKFSLSPHTVQTHRKSIIRKLNIKSPTEFVIYAMDFGLIKPK